MTREDRILRVLAMGRRLCDDCLSDIAEVRPRQSVYQVCSELSEGGVITRLTEQCEACARMKRTNAIVSGRPGQEQDYLPRRAAADARRPNQVLIQHAPRPWYWEGCVQARVAEYLASAGVRVVSQTDTAKREQGKDIEAIQGDGSVLWVSVKGFPESSPNIQARHWFAAALLDLALYRSESRHASLALAFPAGFSTYEKLVQRCRTTLAFLDAKVFWVRQDGTVVCEEASGASTLPRTGA